MSYRSTKTFGHELGLSACFRQWRADSHCRFLHGYALSFKLTFEAEELDERNWVIDFGSLKPVKAWLVEMFDHRLLIARDDPEKDELIRLCLDLNIAEYALVDKTGCEAFAELVAGRVNDWLYTNGHHPRVRLIEVECREHGANSAIWRR